KLPIERKDWRRLSPDEQQSRLEEYLSSDKERGFVFSKAPLMRLSLIQLGERAYRFVWTRHHLLMDGWSVPLLLKEVFAYYESYSRGEQLELAERRPYGDYIAWLQQQDLSKAESHWRETLDGFTTPTPLPLDRQFSGRSPEHGEYLDQRISLTQEVTARLQEFTRRHRLTVNTIVQGAWALLLSEYSCNDDVLFGAVVSGRQAEMIGIEEMIGLFINTLPVRVSVNPDITALEYLTILQRQQVAQREYEFSPLFQVQEWSKIPRGKALFLSVLVFENLPAETSSRKASKGAARFKIRRVQSAEQTNYPLNIIVAPGRELRFRISYDRLLFDEATIRRALNHLKAIIEGVITAPGQKLGMLAMSSEEERTEILVRWNDNQSAYPDNLCIHELYE
ncbi:MAG: non-ribosomal peptide synthetase, partial [Acidobacteria bacterium]